MAHADVNDLVPVGKNGKFFGYADKRQLRDNPKLKLFDKAKAAAEVALQEQKAAEAELKAAEALAVKDAELAKKQAADAKAKEEALKKADKEEKALTAKEAAEKKKAVK